MKIHRKKEVCLTKRNGRDYTNLFFIWWWKQRFIFHINFFRRNWNFYCEKSYLDSLQKIILYFSQIIKPMNMRKLFKYIIHGRVIPSFSCLITSKLSILQALRLFSLISLDWKRTMIDFKLIKFYFYVKKLDKKTCQNHTSYYIVLNYYHNLNNYYNSPIIINQKYFNLPLNKNHDR